MDWKLRINFTDGSSIEDDEEYDSKEDAIISGEEWLDSWEEGKEVLMESGEDYDDREIDDYEIIEEPSN